MNTKGILAYNEKRHYDYYYFEMYCPGDYNKLIYPFFQRAQMHSLHLKVLCRGSYYCFIYLYIFN